jgi:NAD(P)-dependent dehydrogenase (short-subunit alcohol dehydrogenase family)
MRHWTHECIPDQSGRIAVVTGANTGIGYEAARALARHGAEVILACRDKEKGGRAAGRIRAEGPKGVVQPMHLDLSDLTVVRRFADSFRGAYRRLDMLVNNAGVMVPPFSKTAQGLELQFGVNFLGHFALTGLLIDRITSTPGSRVVTVSSLAGRVGRIDFDNLRAERSYRPIREYAQSKLADLVFALELERRLRAGRIEARSIAAHPGFTRTDLQRNSPLANFLVDFWCNSAEQGALPTLFAATAPDAAGGGYYGPHGILEARGFPAEARIPSRARDRETARRLWRLGEELANVTFLPDLATQ